MFVDFLRFQPEKCELLEGFDFFVVFNSKNLVRASTTSELQKQLKKAKGFVGVMSDNVKVNREAIMRRKVNAILDFEDRALDYTSIKMAKEKDVVIEVSLSKFLRTKSFKRSKLLEETRLLLKLLLKFETPFLLTTGANSCLEARPRKQVYRFFSFLAKDSGIDSEKLIKLAKKNSYRIYRMLNDENYIMDGVEVLE